MQQVKCDKCGIVGEPEKEYLRQPEAWFYLTYKLNSYKNKEYDLCALCGKSLGLAKDAEPETVADRLLEIINEIAQDAISQIT